MTETVLEVDRVHKQFKDVRAVDDVSFDVRRGEIFALLGPNGAGKTTLVRMLLGVIRPDSGAVNFRTPEGGRLGYLPEDRGLYKDIPVIRTLTYFGMLNGLSRADAAAAADDWLGRMDLLDRRKDKLETLSKGNQQKVQFVASVLHGPAFAVLDEPFSGLDPLNQDFFIDIVRSLRDAGTTILLSAHQMPLVERVADRILLINKGRAVRSGTLADLQAAGGLGSRIGFRLAAPVEAVPGLENHPAVAAATLTEPTFVEVEVKPGASLSELLAEAGGRLTITEVRSQPPSLHDIYVQAVRESGQEIDEAALAAGGAA